MCQARKNTHTGDKPLWTFLFFSFLFTALLFFWRQSCYVSRNRLWTPDPAASALGAGIKVAGGLHNTLGLTMKCQARMNLEILGKKGPQFHRSLHLLTKYTKVNPYSLPIRIPSILSGLRLLLQGHNSARTCWAPSQSGQVLHEI